MAAPCFSPRDTRPLSVKAQGPGCVCACGLWAQALFEYKQAVRSGMNKQEQHLPWSPSVTVCVCKEQAEASKEQNTLLSRNFSLQQSAKSSLPALPRAEGHPRLLQL